MMTKFSIFRLLLTNNYAVFFIYILTLEVFRESNTLLVLY